MPGGEVVVYDMGEGPDTVFLVNGGPGIASDGIRADHAWLVDRGWRVVAHDQLGTGASDCPDDPALWTVERYGDEVEAVIRALDLGPVHYLGHSWGGWLGCDYVCRYPGSVKSFIAANTGADMALHIAELRRLIAAFGEETLTMVDRHEACGTLDDPEYRAFRALFYFRHSERRPTAGRPPAREYRLNMQVQNALWGPADFSCTGNMRDWSRLADLRGFDRPTLVFNGYHDYITIHEGAAIHAAVPGSRMHVFAGSGHAPARDEPEAYRAAVEQFLEQHR